MADADLTLVVIDLSTLRSTPMDLDLIRRAKEQGGFVVAGNKCDLAEAGGDSGRRPSSSPR